MVVEGQKIEPELSSPVVNPATGKVIAEVPVALDQQIEKAVRAAKR